MLSAVRTALAAAAIALTGLAGAGTAAAKPAKPLVGPQKLALKLCIPHTETRSKYLGIKKIGYRYYRVYLVYTIYVNRLCQKRVIAVKYKYIPLFWHLRKKPAGV